MVQALWVIMIVAGPPLILMCVIGFVISIIQTATSINEPTISFIPKLLMLVLFLAIYGAIAGRSEEHTSELQSLMRISYAVFCLKKKKKLNTILKKTNSQNMQNNYIRQHVV